MDFGQEGVEDLKRGTGLIMFKTEQNRAIIDTVGHNLVKCKQKPKKIYVIPFPTTDFKEFMVPEFEMEGFQIFPAYPKDED